MGSRPNVIFVVLDTVRADRVSALGYDRETTPNLDAFAEKATLFTDAVAQAPWSIPSHASLFTGEYPAAHDATTASLLFTGGPTLPQRLSAAGYDTYAFSTNEYVRPATGFSRGFDEFHTPARVTEPAILADLFAPAVSRLVQMAPVRRWMERAFNRIRERQAVTTTPQQPTDDNLLETTTSIFARAHEPFFVFVNLADAHLPRSPAPEHVERFVDPALADAPVLANERAYTIGDAEMTDRGFRRLCQLYDADVRTVDDRFGAFLDLLDTSGVLADTLVVAVSDHGEHLGEFGRVGHQFSVFDSVISVPLAVQFPHEDPGCVDEQVEIRRLFHTILDETGIQSFPERTLASGNGDAVARGSYHSPMVDIASLCSDGRVRYKDELLGEPLSFARTPEAKLLAFNGEEWLFGVPERCRSPLEIARAPETREKLSRQLPGQS